MYIKKNIKKALLMTLWIILGSCVLVLSIAAVDIKNQQACRGVMIQINGVKEYLFLSKKDIMEIISDKGENRPEGKALASFNLQDLESVLEKNVWVRDAELFFDNNDLLHAIIMEKEPVARIFTTTGYSFYIDSAGGSMPLSDKVRVKIPVFTGFPWGVGQAAKPDSAMIKGIKAISRQILDDPFWMAQIAQVAIMPDRNFEMIPTVGSHVIQFGNADSASAKFRRLYIFFMQVLSKTGFDKYSKISVQYDKQVIGTKKGITAKYDSVQALKNIQKMIDEARKIYSDSVYTPSESFAPSLNNDSSVTGVAIKNIDSAKKHEKKSNPPASRPVKPAIASENKQLATPDVKETKQPLPKAVMKKE